MSERIGLHDLDLDRESARHLWRLCMFAEEWEGKVVEYVCQRKPTDEWRLEKALCIGHDGPIYSEHLGWTATPFRQWLGWGNVVFLLTPGHQHYTDPRNVKLIKEIDRAKDTFCPYGCDRDGLLDWHVDWSGPEYETFCPIHRAEDRKRGEDLYFANPFDGTQPELEAAWWEHHKIAYRAEAATA